MQLFRIFLSYIIFAFFLLSLFACNNRKIRSCAQIKDKYFDLTDSTISNAEKNQFINELKKYLERQRNCPEAYVALGDIYKNINLLDTAYEYYNYAIMISNNNVYATFMCGFIQQLKGNYNSAIEYYTTAMSYKTVDGFVVNIDPNFSDISGRPTFDIPYSKIVVNRGICFYLNGDLSSSLHAFDYCIQNNQYLKEAYRYRSLIYFNLKDSSKAASDKRMLEMLGQ